MVKAGFQFADTNWQLTWLDQAGQRKALSAGQTQRLTQFNIVPYRVGGLTVGQTYRLRFQTRNAGGDSVKVERLYTHRLSGPRWLRLAHAPLVGGDFAGSALSTDNTPERDDRRLLSVWRYQNESKWQTLYYDTQNDDWVPVNAQPPTPRHGLIRYRLRAVEGVYYDLAGLGFLVNEVLPSQRVYLKDMGGLRIIEPFFAGPDGEVRFFTTLDRAYQLVEGSQQVWVRRGDWGQYRTTDFPEPTGTLATFRIGDTGYVVNQRPGQAAHLWAFDMQREQWSRRADFPGPVRRQGIGFTAGSRVFFGLGLNANEDTLRDLWQYDPATDRWQYVTDYPGQGSIYLTVGQQPGRTFLGWGYEHQPTAAGGIRLVGCTDWWEIQL
ncbi:hypothetical protein DYU11_26355 [Fibrisoma montanum]|uniref:Galactose oxidase n=1 Tax=Fibrisoma montanum TaxID=2305895 RepID=A0A418M0F8_9BACT|nr:hypothetical protein [Fibrisoma montanum]RIV19023.1 hypothetical protein DYU11_26355 [Fibrisoma montanum]